VNAIIIPQNWGAIPFLGASPLRRYCPPIPRNDDRIHRYILPRTTVFPQYASSSSNKEKCYCYIMYIECLITKIPENILFNALL
jgi:hypothetical protein